MFKSLSINAEQSNTQIDPSKDLSSPLNRDNHNYDKSKGEAMFKSPDSFNLS